MFIIELLVILAALIMGAAHAWMQGGGPVNLRYSYATILMLFLSLLITLSWTHYGIPK